MAVPHGPASQKWRWWRNHCCVARQVRDCGHFTAARRRGQQHSRPAGDRGYLERARRQPVRAQEIARSESEVGRRPVVRDDTCSDGQGAPSGRPDCALIAILVATLALAMSSLSFAQGRTDVVTLANGDRITGEVVRVERGRLEFKTDDVGTLYLEWDKLSSLVANRFV